MRPQLIALCWLLMQSTGTSAQAIVPVERWEAVERRAFDTVNFTQGLEIHNDVLWVSSGLRGQSAVRRYHLEDLSLIDEEAIADRYFAEGLTVLDARVLLLTWQAREMLVLDAETLELQASTPFPTEGWGITHTDERVWFSNGSDRLYHFAADAEDSKIESVAVTLNGRPVPRLNELEWINGEIWANVWQTDQIIRIDPLSGVVKSIVDLRELFPRHLRPPGSDVLNGIAFDAKTGAIWVTGKRWPWLFSIAPPEPE